MDALCAAIPVARALLRAADASAPRTLTVAAGSRRATLRLERGRVLEVNGVDSEPLGDTLLALGALDGIRHRAALEAAFPAERVGAWLVSVGAASEEAVRAALTLQLARRVESVLRLRGAELVLSDSSGSLHGGYRVSAPLVPTVYAGLVSIARELPDMTQRARASEGALCLTRLGQWLEGQLGRSTEDFAHLLGASPAPELRAERAALRAIGALVDQNSGLDGYSLLLRKRRELSRRASARRLLDLPEGARPELARLAFRRLARKLHPDRFHAAQPGLTDLSNEVMCALASAEAELSAQAARPRRVAT